MSVVSLRIQLVLLALLLALPTAFAGQSVQLLKTVVSSEQVEAQSSVSACRVEVSFHDWDPNPPANSRPWDAPACGFEFTLYNLGTGDIYVQMFSAQGGAGCIVHIGVDTAGNPILPTPFVTLRFQRLPLSAAEQATYKVSGFGFVELCEATDQNGRTFYSDSHVSQGSPKTLKPGASVGDLSSLKVSTAYFRLFTSTVPLGSRPPVTADQGDLLEWKFDGNLEDGSPHHYPEATVTGLSPTYGFTPGQDLVKAVLRTKDAPPWSSWSSLRAGFPNELDCSQSYSQADVSAEVDCAWIQDAGPSTAAWSSLFAKQPTVTNLQFGTYTFQLIVQDQTGAYASTKLDVGSVSYDAQGGVIPEDPRVREIFGPMIAFGKNPWGYADERAKRAVELQAEYLQRVWKPTWSTNGQGTIQYPFAGIGPIPGQPGTNLTQAITAESTLITINDAAKLPGLASLPTWILIGNSIGSQEAVRVIATSATRGQATLTVAYDGRGLSTNPSGAVQVSSAAAWAAGTTVGEMRIQGAGTLFVSDPQRPLCPAGAPGPLGPVVHSDGSVLPTLGSTRITGLQPSLTQFFSNGNDPKNSIFFIRVEATHGGQPFVWWAQITGFDAATSSIQTNRVFPRDADPGPFPYKITGPRYLSVEFHQEDGSVQRMLQNGLGCESETAAFAVPSRDIPAFDLTNQSNVGYSYKDQLGAQSAFGPNFYGSGLASRAFYLRSGWELARKTADAIDEYWVRDPEVCGGWCGWSALLQGGGAIGAIADLVLNPDSKLTWSDVRAFAARGSIGNTGCNASDTRDSGYMEAWVALAALYDPDDSFRDRWKSALAEHADRDVRCKQDDGSWANGFLFNRTYSPAFTVTNGSTLATGSNLPSSLCFGTAVGNVTVTNGVAEFTGAGLIPGAKITIYGTRNGEAFASSFQFKIIGDGGLLAALWPGDSGTFSYVIESSDQLTSIGTDNDDPQLKKNWACVWNSPTQFTLNRPWDGPSTDAAHLFSYVLSGYGQQPYMLGIKITALNWASQVDDFSLRQLFFSLASEASSWIRTTGFDPITQGMHNGRIYEMCEPLTSPPAQSAELFHARSPGCNFGANQGAIRTARVLSAEANPALLNYYQTHPLDGFTWEDTVYGSIWGYCPYTAPGYYCDPNFVRDEVSDQALGSYKWPGFFFGMGMAHQWPAIRTQRGPRR